MALVLSRKRNESFRVGDDIIITVVEIRGDKTRLAINAPPTLPCHREEVYRAIERNGGAASFDLSKHAGSSLSKRIRQIVHAAKFEDRDAAWMITALEAALISSGE
jgi:carbon storage regulator